MSNISEYEIELDLRKQALEQAIKLFSGASVTVTVSDIAKTAEIFLNFLKSGKA